LILQSSQYLSLEQLKNSGLIINKILDPAIPLLGIYPDDVPTGNKDTCSSMFIAAFFIMARSWKEPRCPSTEEWIQKIWNIYTMEYYSAIKNNEFMKFLGQCIYFILMFPSLLYLFWEDRSHGFSKHSPPPFFFYKSSPISSSINQISL
jgi:hypothetical protein